MIQEKGAFIAASYFLSKEFERRKMDPNLSTEITLIAIIFGIIGAKIFSLLENWSAFIADPLGEIFSPGGLTFYGGFLLATLAIYITIKTPSTFDWTDNAGAGSTSVAMTPGTSQA